MKYLAYHSIGKDNGEVGAGLYCVKEEEFRKQMECVAKRIETVSSESGDSLCVKYLETVSAQNVQRQSPPKAETVSSGIGDSLCVSFDDGDSTNFTTAYPILKELRLKAYFFIIGNKIGTDGYMDWEQIKELKDNGMVIGSHGMTHRILAGLSDDELDYELKDSKKILEENLGQEIECISIPRGFYTENIISKIKETGYKNAFTSNIKDNDGFKIGRVVVKGDWDIDYFKKVMENGLGIKDRVREMIKDSAKKVLGVNSYDKIRNRILR